MVKNDETTNNGINLAENKNNTTDKNESSLTLTIHHASVCSRSSPRHLSQAA